MEFHSLGSVGPVTALCVYGNSILAGCGSVVQMYQAGTGKLQTAFLALPCTTVHGFRLGPVCGGKHLCVFGAKCVRILQLDMKTQDVETTDNSDSHSCRLQAATAVHKVEDWIWDVAWLQNGDRWTLGLALAHNVVLHWDWHTGDILQRVTCTEKCILYCAHFIGSSWSDLVLAAGTVFNQVVMWSPGNGGHGDCGDDQALPVLHRLTGHQGVIFSIFYHAGLQRICSVSDDRSIIMYQLHFPASMMHTPSDSASIVMDWNRVTIEPMLTLFGHSGRVWDVVLLSELFVSVGEDAHCIVWSYSGDILHKHRGHKGRSIWSLAASEDESYVVTGGGDSSIRQWHLQGNSDLPLTQVQLAIPRFVKVCADDFVRTLALWDFDTVVLMTNAGSLLCYSVSGGRWQTLCHDADFASYSTLAMSPNTTYLAVASILGHVRVLHRGQEGCEGGISQTKTSLHSGKICGLTWVNEDHVLTTGLHGHCVLAAVQHSAAGTVSISVVAQLELPSCKHRWVVSGCLLSSSPPQSPSSPTSGEIAHLVCGDRSGSVHCYKITQTASGAETEFPPVQMFPKIHGSAGVTCVRCHDNTIFTSGRDGQYRRWALNNHQLQLLNTSRVFKGFDWIDRLWIEGKKLYVLGFYSTKFIVWDVERGERRLEVECGGGHRAWDFLGQQRGQGEDYRFLFIKAREAVMVTGGQTSGQDIIKPPLHGMKVWDMKCIHTYTDSTGGAHHVMCTGSEDTTLSLGTLHSDTATGSLQWTGQHTLHAHLSSVRTVVTVPSATSMKEGTDLSHPEHSVPSQTCIRDSCAGSQPAWGSQPVSAVVFSAGGRAQIQAWRVIVTEEKSSSTPLPSSAHSSTPLPSSAHSSTPLPSSAHSSTPLPSVAHSSTPLPGSAHSSTPLTSLVHSSEQSDNPQAGVQTCDSQGNGKMEPRHEQISQGVMSPTYLHEKKQNMPSVNYSHAVDCPGSSAEGSSAAGLSSCRKDSVHCKHEQNSCTVSYEHLGGCFLGESRHKRPHKPWKIRYLKLDPETRVMCLAAVAAQQLDHRLLPHLHVLVAAGSDGILRLFLFDETRHHFTLLCQSSHHNGCILKVLIHLHPTPSTPCSLYPSAPIPFLLSAATDGRIALWDLRPVVQWLLDAVGQKHPSSCHGDDSVSQRGGQTSESNTGAREKAVKSGRDWVDEPDCDQFPTVTGEPGPGSHGDESDTNDDNSKEEESEDDSDKNQACSTRVERNMTRTQYLGESSAASLQQKLAGAHQGVFGASLAGRKFKEGVPQDQHGHLSGWSPNQEFHAHQSGVNSLHVKSLADGSLLLASGGDDNALTIHRLTLTSAGKGTGSTDTLTRADTGTCSMNTSTFASTGTGIGSADRLTHGKTSPGNESTTADCRHRSSVLEVVSVITKTDAHAAHITGVWVLSGHHVVTASIDQRVNLWHLTPDSQLQLESCRFVDVADLSSMEVWLYQNCVYVGVCGEGMALLSVLDPSSRDGARLPSQEECVDQGASSVA